LYFIRHILRFFSRTIPGLFRGSHELIVAVDHPLSRKVALRALSGLHRDLRGRPVLKLLRIRKRLRLQPHGVRLELEAMPPLPRILGLPGLSKLSRRLEDYFYYLQRRFRLMGLSLESGSPSLVAGNQFPGFLQGDCLYLSYLMVQPAGWHPEEDWSTSDKLYNGPDSVPFHLNRAYRILARLRAGRLLNQTWQEALLFSGNRRWEGYLVQNSPVRLMDLSYAGPSFQASFRDPDFISGRMFRPAPSHYSMTPVSSTEFPHLPFERKSVNLFFVDASLRIHIYRSTLMDPVNHRLHLKARRLPYHGTGLQRILDIPETSLDLPEPGLWVYGSSAVLELERVETVDILDCDYRNSVQIRLKSGPPARPIVYGRN
tara:strand:+ start:2585 stop:3703 length:1119 start_codon:yes stop_codon:yes gene_type:complete